MPTDNFNATTGRETPANGILQLLKLLSREPGQQPAPARQIDPAKARQAIRKALAKLAEDSADGKLARDALNRLNGAIVDLMHVFLGPEY